LTLGALGVTGLVEWPLLLAVGGGALVLRRLSNSRSDSAPARKTKVAAVTPPKVAAVKSTNSTRPRKTPAKKTPARQSSAAQSRTRR
jgi:hypothetical protein